MLTNCRMFIKLTKNLCDSLLKNFIFWLFLNKSTFSIDFLLKDFPHHLLHLIFPKTKKKNLNILRVIIRDGNRSDSARIIHIPTLLQILVKHVFFNPPPLGVELCILQICPDSDSQTSNGVGYRVGLLSNFIVVILY